MTLSTLTDQDLSELARRAVEARQWAYAPYSHYHVGAALLMASGKIYDGVNVENASYPNTICAECTAMVKAVSEGEREVLAVAVATENGGTPCGKCRQVLSEFGREAQVVIVNGAGEIVRRTTMAELLPLSFGPEKLS